MIWPDEMIKPLCGGLGVVMTTATRVSMEVIVTSKLVYLCLFHLFRGLTTYLYRGYKL